MADDHQTTPTDTEDTIAEIKAIHARCQDLPDGPERNALLDQAGALIEQSLFKLLALCEIENPDKTIH